MGYDRRALNLRRAARAIVADHGGGVPRDLAALERLPGIGPYTARAVAAIAFGARGRGGRHERPPRPRPGARRADPALDPPRRLQAAADASVDPGPARRLDPRRHGHRRDALPARAARLRGLPAATWCRFAAASARRPAPTRARRTAGSPGARARARPRSFARRPAGCAAGSSIGCGSADGPAWTVVAARSATTMRRPSSAALAALARDGIVELDPDRIRAGLASPSA